eukprot:1893637-Prymnesium_polylepis.1
MASPEEAATLVQTRTHLGGRARARGRLGGRRALLGAQEQLLLLRGDVGVHLLERRQHLLRRRLQGAPHVLTRPGSAQGEQRTGAQRSR